MHQMSRILRLIIALVLIATAALVTGPRPALAVGGAVVIDPSDTTTDPVANLGQWGPINVRSDGSVALTCDNPRNGDGSIAFGSPSGSAKADFANYWGVVAGRTLGNLSAFSYEWYRDSSSTNPTVQVPALRLSYLTQAGESGYLIYEPVYNDYPGGALTDTWVASNAFAGNFWMRAFGPGRTIDDYNISLAEWIANADEEGSPIDDDQDGHVPHVLSANTSITGVEVGVGSGWNGVFTGYADTIRIAFGAGDDTTWNFEGACTPPTGSLEITKSVSWGSFPADAAATFEICISGNGLAQPICDTFSAGESVTFDNLAPGDYTVSETDPGAVWTVSGEGVVSVTANATAEATVTNTHAAYSRINLVSVCSNDPTVTRRWRVDNPNPYPVEFTYTVYGTSQTGTLVVPANSNGANPFFFETATVAGANTTTISVNGVQQAVKASGGQSCPGSLEVTKRVNWDGFAPKAASFEICIKGPSYPNGREPGACQTVSVTGNEGTNVVNLTATWTNLAPGAYKVTETDPGASWIVTGNGATVQVAAGGTGRTTIVNKFCSLISKRIVMNVDRRTGDVIARVYIEFTDGYNAFVTDVEAEWTLPNGTKLPVRVQTNGSGMATFRLRNPPAGTYTITVLNVDWPGEQLNLNKGVRVKSITKS